MAKKRTAKKAAKKSNPLPPIVEKSPEPPIRPKVTDRTIGVNTFNPPPPPPPPQPHKVSPPQPLAKFKGFGNILLTLPDKKRKMISFKEERARVYMTSDPEIIKVLRTPAMAAKGIQEI